jgi:hypothetical protein
VAGLAGSQGMTLVQVRLRLLTVIAALLFLIFAGFYLATLDLSPSYLLKAQTSSTWVDQRN